MTETEAQTKEDEDEKKNSAKGKENTQELPDKEMAMETDASFGKREDEPESQS